MKCLISKRNWKAGDGAPDEADGAEDVGGWGD